MLDRQKQNTTVSASPVAKRKDRHIRQLTSEVAYRTRLQKICNKINAAENLDEILINLKDDITSLFEAERITVYVVDKNTDQLVSRFKSGTDIEEIRIPISAKSIAGWCAMKNSIINIKDALQNLFAFFCGKAYNLPFRKGQAEILDQTAPITEWLSCSDSAIHSVFMRQGKHLFCGDIYETRNSILGSEISIHP